MYLLKVISRSTPKCHGSATLVFTAGVLGPSFAFCCVRLGPGRLILIRIQKGIKMAPRQRKLLGKRSSFVIFIDFDHLEIFNFCYYVDQGMDSDSEMSLIWNIACCWIGFIVAVNATKSQRQACIIPHLAFGTYPNLVLDKFRITVNWDSKTTKTDGKYRCRTTPPAQSVNHAGFVFFTPLLIVDDGGERASKSKKV